jgi:hypothetical protein
VIDHRDQGMIVMINEEIRSILRTTVSTLASIVLRSSVINLSIQAPLSKTPVLTFAMKLLSEVLRTIDLAHLP